MTDPIAATPIPKSQTVMPVFRNTSHETRSIERWVVERVAFYLECRVDDVDPAVSLAETGIDSASAVGLCGDVEDYWQIDADPTLVFDYPTIADIAAFIAESVTPMELAA
jgi:acyl carrier protein